MRLPSAVHWTTRAALAALVVTVMIAPASRADETDALLQRFEAMVRYNLDNPVVVESAILDSLAGAWQTRSLGERTAAWARWFLEQGKSGYRYGRDPGGYVEQGRICQDFETDCVLFMYRVTELARSSNAREAVQFAFGTRFYGASVAGAILEDGRVNYDDPAHLEYSEEMIRSGIWGADVTAECGRSQLDAAGSLKVPPDTLRYLPAGGIDEARLQDGDIAWFIGDEAAPGAAEARKAGTMVHHLGILEREGGTVNLIHPAARPLPGVYERTGVVRVPLRLYLERVGRFKGIVVTRLPEF